MVSLVVREGAVYLVALRDGGCDNDDATFDGFPLLIYIEGCVKPWEKSMKPRAVCRSRGRSYLVALRDGCCGNDDELQVTHRTHVLGNIC